MGGTVISPTETTVVANRLILSVVWHQVGFTDLSGMAYDNDKQETDMVGKTFIGGKWIVSPENLADEGALQVF